MVSDMQAEVSGVSRFTKVSLQRSSVINSSNINLRRNVKIASSAEGHKITSDQI